jgi:hypothetical protein
MILVQPIGIPNGVCICGHYSEDHTPRCQVIEYGLECSCICFVPDKDDNERYWFSTKVDCRWKVSVPDEGGDRYGFGFDEMAENGGLT